MKSGRGRRPTRRNPEPARLTLRRYFSRARLIGYQRPGRFRLAGLIVAPSPEGPASQRSLHYVQVTSGQWSVRVPAVRCDGSRPRRRHQVGPHGHLATRLAHGPARRLSPQGPAHEPRRTPDVEPSRRIARTSDHVRTDHSVRSALIGHATTTPCQGHVLHAGDEPGFRATLHLP